MDALESINNLSRNFENAASTLRLSMPSAVASTPATSRIDKLQLKIKALKESADFYQAKGPQYKTQLERVMTKYEKAHKKLMIELSLGDSSDDSSTD